MKKLIIGIGSLATIVMLVTVLSTEEVVRNSEPNTFIVIDIEPVEVEPVEYIEFEPIEIRVPLTVLDFTNEEPTLITPTQ